MLLFEGVCCRDDADNRSNLVSELSQEPVRSPGIKAAGRGGKEGTPVHDESNYFDVRCSSCQHR